MAIDPLLALALAALAIALEVAALVRAYCDRGHVERIWKRLRGGWLDERAVRPPDPNAVRVYGPIAVSASAQACDAAARQRGCAVSLPVTTAALADLASDVRAGLVKSVAIAGAAADAASSQGKVYLRGSCGWADGGLLPTARMPLRAPSLFLSPEHGGCNVPAAWAFGLPVP